MEKAKNTFIKDDQRRKRWRLIAINALALVGAFAVAGLMGFVHYKRSEMHCYGVEVRIEQYNGTIFITEESVLSAVNAKNDSVVGKVLKDINTAAIHQRLVDNPWIAKANVYTAVDGRCIVEVTQRTPIARVLGSDGSNYYLDQNGYIMPASRIGTVRVPVFTGEITEPKYLPINTKMHPDSALKTWGLWDDIYVFTGLLQQNDFMQAQTEHIVITPQRKFQIVPRVGDHRINIGSIDHLAEKFKKLLTFYSSTVRTKDLNQYKNINLEYHNQVVCEKVY